MSPVLAVPRAALMAHRVVVVVASVVVAVVVFQLVFASFDLFSSVSSLSLSLRFALFYFFGNLNIEIVICGQCQPAERLGSVVLPVSLPLSFALSTCVHASLEVS